MNKQILSVVKVSALAFALSLGISYVYAWTAPTVAAPGGNVAAPINTSATAQTKAGDFTVGGLSLPVGGMITGSGANSTYGSLTVNGSKNGWQGINFPGAGTVMMNPSYSGFYNAADNAWRMLVTDTGGAGAFGNGNVYANDYYSYAAGKWMSAPAGGVTSLTAGTGITLSPNPITTTGTITADTTILQKRVAAAGCATGSSIRVVNADGTVVCQLDNVGGAGVSSVSAGTGIQNTGTAANPIITNIGTTKITASNGLNQISYTGATPGTGNVTLGLLAQTCTSPNVATGFNASGVITCTPAGGTPSIGVYQCPNGKTPGANPSGGAWGSYGCQGQISSISSCQNVEYPWIENRTCSYLGTLRVN